MTTTRETSSTPREALHSRTNGAQHAEPASTGAQATPATRASLEKVAGWGQVNSTVSRVFRPTTVAGLQEIFDLARRSGESIGLRGGGNSYGDASLNSENIVVDLRRMNRILAWDPHSGLIRLEPGVTLEQLWRYVIEDGWWPPVATGTMKITMGGGAAMNVHGKNAWRVGPLGDHIREFELLLPSGEIIHCSRDENAGIFFAAIGGFGMLGCFTSLTIQMKRIYSGLLNVEALAARNLGEMMAYFERHLDDSDYLVGWLDAFARGKRLGRGQIHRATHLAAGEDPDPAATLNIERQAIPTTIAGIFPKFWLPPFMRLFYNDPGWRLVCWAKYLGSRLLEGLEGKRYQEPHARFHFLLDALPFRNVYGPGGMIQYQAFIPTETAYDAFVALFELQQARGLPNYLSVLKRHRPDPFLMTHSLDGYSMAMDFHITNRNRSRIAQLARDMDEIVLNAGGRFYFAKDSTLRPEVVRAYLGEETIAQFMALKEQCDPGGLLETNLWRRLFA